MKLRAAILVCALACPGFASAQTPARRATSPAALLTYPGFFQGQPVVVRGTLSTRDQAVLLAPSISRSIPLIFTGTSPADGEVELRATFWDVGRLQRDDPRINSLGLQRLLTNPEGDWPKPGDVVALIVSEAVPLKAPETPPSLREITLSPDLYVGQRVTISGQFRGRNLYGDVPQAPNVSQWDFVLHSGDSALWVTGERPRGKGFNLDVGARIDTKFWLQVTGTVRQGRGLVWIEAAPPLVLAKPEVEHFAVESIAPEVGPSPEVIFSDPENGEVDVALKKVVRLQFSRDMDPASFKDHVHWRYASGATGPLLPQSELSLHYEGVNRSLEIKIDNAELIRSRSVTIDLTDEVLATDGAKLKPTSLTFTFTGQ